MIEKQYLANRIANANEAELVAIVYEGLIDTLEDSIDYLSIKADNSLGKSIEKAREILAELLSTLEGDTEIANNLKSMYLYINELITAGHNNKDVEKLKLAIKVLTPIYEGWKELSTREGTATGKENPQGPKIVAGITYGKDQLHDYVINDTNQWEKG